MEIVDNIRTEIEKFNKKREELVESLQKEFPSLLLPLFEQTDKIQSISWTQYTPYFNDGDECVFSAHVDYLDINGVDPYDTDEEDVAFDINRTLYLDKIETQEQLDRHVELAKETGNHYQLNKKIGDSYGLADNPKYNKEVGDTYHAFTNVLGSIPTDFYKDLFGDHVKVTVYRDGRIEKKDYDHD